MLDERSVSDPGATSDASGSRRPRARLALLAAPLTLALVGGALWFTMARESDPSAAVPRFVDATSAAGVEHRYEGGFDFFVGGGVAVLDCDDDAFPDLYVAGGSAPAALFRNASTTGGDLRFELVPSPVTDLPDVTGAYPLDVDSDGVPDLVVLRSASASVVLRGLGDCRFEPAAEQPALPDGVRTAAFSATWEGANALPTLAFGSYLEQGSSECAPSLLVRPEPAGGYAAPLPLATHCALSVLFSDWGRTGRRDLRVSNDRHYYTDGGEQMWRVEPGAAPVEYTAADGWQPLRIWGMGIASRDVTGDGKPEVYLTSQGDNKLQTLAPEAAAAAAPMYRDIALERGVTAQRPVSGGDVLPSTAWHPEFDDVNNDGHTDLFITKGNVEAQPDYADRDPNDLFLGRADGTFVAAAEEAGIVRFERSRGAAVTDLDLDGLADLVVVNRQANVEVWRNVGSGTADRPVAMGHWLGIGLSQPAPNVDAVGAWIDVRTAEGATSHEVTVGGGHAGGELGWIHVGLGEAATAEVRVQWPDGEVGPWMAVDADQLVMIDRTADRPIPVEP
jgi:hypothetical protein